MNIASFMSNIAGEPALIAGFIGLIMLIFLTVPFIIIVKSNEARLRSSMIERHRAKLREDSLRRGRGSRGEGPHDNIYRMLQLVRFIPYHIRTDKGKLLRSAGFGDERAVAVFWIFKTLFLLFGIAIFSILILFPDFLRVSFYNAALIVAMTFTGYFYPDFFVRQRRKTRLQRIERGLPDGLDLLVICAEAGLSLDSALKRVADEFAAMTPELSEELLLTSIELNFLPDRRQALLNLAHRVDVPAIRGVTATLIQTEKYGTPLAQALRTLASEFRDNRLLRAEDKAARLPAILTIPMIVFILPALFIVLAAPAFIKVAEKIGN